MLGLQFMKIKLSREDSIKGRFKSNGSDVESVVSKDISDNQKAINLVYVVLCYLTVVIITGSVSILIYLIVVKEAGHLLIAKGINLVTFSVF